MVYDEMRAIIDYYIYEEGYRISFGSKNSVVDCIDLIINVKLIRVEDINEYRSNIEFLSLFAIFEKFKISEELLIEIIKFYKEEIEWHKRIPLDSYSLKFKLLYGKYFK